MLCNFAEEEGAVLGNIWKSRDCNEEKCMWEELRKSRQCIRDEAFAAKMLLRQFMHRAGRIRQNPVAEKAECLIWEKCTYQIGRKYDIIKHTE